MEVQTLFKELDSDFFTGVPDSQLRVLCDCLMDSKGICSSHIIAANEGNAVAIAAGNYLATGKVPVIYMQNSGIGNAVNPALSLINEKVYGIPCIFVIGWRGEPGVHDEPQHVRQGELTIQLLKCIGLKVCIIDTDTSGNDIKHVMDECKEWFAQGKSLAFVVKKGALKSDMKVCYKNPYMLLREEVIECIVDISGQDVIVATTGKAGRELYEVRERKGLSHQCDFLTVGSMGHCSSIALGIAMSQSDTKVWCIDGDGAVLMHLGAMAVIGNQRPNNLVHVVINNEAHESVGGMPTVAATMNIPQIALGCGYEYAVSIQTMDELKLQLQYTKEVSCLSLIEVKCAIGARENLGRPVTTPKENRDSFMEFLKSANSALHKK
ncbi:MAG: phosphonopyruvate decarboxylase [Eubacterium sp.]|nr:phosphonopyruvate decarboxylase [Eubacterium sp.]